MDMIKSPTLDQIDRTRKNNFRPTVVACIIFNKKVLFAHRDKYDVWMFPQGGVDNKETVEVSLIRELKEEMGEEVVSSAYVDCSYLGQDRVEFSSAKHNVRKLFTDSGEKVDMYGKHYYIYVVNFSTSDIMSNESEFDQYAWVNYNESEEITSQIYHKNKKKIIQKILYSLHKNDIIE
jgi:8-oxo-dGTP pyrophosphatase MutT (NUDIX family)